RRSPERGIQNSSGSDASSQSGWSRARIGPKIGPSIASPAARSLVLEMRYTLGRAAHNTSMASEVPSLESSSSNETVATPERSNLPTVRGRRSTSSLAQMTALIFTRCPVRNPASHPSGFRVKVPLTCSEQSWNVIQSTKGVVRVPIRGGVQPTVARSDHGCGVYQARRPGTAKYPSRLHAMFPGRRFRDPGIDDPATPGAHQLIRVRGEARIPDGVLSEAKRLSAPSRDGKWISLMDAMKVKLACTAHLPVPEAFSVYAGLMGLDDSIGIRTIPIRGLCDAIEKDGEMLALIEPGGRHFECRAPMVIGPANTSSLGGRIRRVVAGRIDNAIVHSRTGAFTRNGELVMDVQGDELDAVPAELAFDPVIFDRQGGMATYLDDSHPGRLRHMREA